jgi:hypothetical protein
VALFVFLLFLRKKETKSMRFFLCTILTHSVKEYV